MPALEPNPNAVYPPAPREETLGNGTTITIPTPNSALGRLMSHVNERYGFDGEGNRATPIDDPLMRDVVILLAQAANAIGTLEIMSTGAFASTEDKPVYAGGVVSEGNRIYTPLEAAQQAMERHHALEGKKTTKRSK